MPPALTRRTLLLQLADTDGKDWRADLLTAVHNVFAKDRDSTQAELRTYKIVHRDQAGLLEAMEDKVRQQVRAAPSPPPWPTYGVCLFTMFGVFSKRLCA